MDIFADIFVFFFSFITLMEEIDDTLKENNMDSPFDEECNTTYSDVGSTESSPAGVDSANRNMYGWQTGSYLNGGLRRRHTNCIELDTDIADRFTVESKPTKRKRGLLTRLRFWKKKSKLSQDVSGIDSDEKNKDKKKSKGWRKFCCL